ncbi:MAG: GrpB family protein [Saprospiraceae bacterium]|nr:GrpB family protein [Saprospiraceae bacterium]
MLFRDALREDAALRGEYLALKWRLAAKYSANREAYTNGKRRFIEDVLSSITTTSNQRS